MAKSKKDDPLPLTTDEKEASRPRLHKLIIKNFGAIGSVPVEVELDEVVVLVGANNSGKSSVLRGYQTVMSHGSNEAKLNINDFPNSVVDPENLPEIELHTIVYTDAPGERWIYKTEDNELLIRERWIWDSPNVQPRRQGFDVAQSAWSDNVPWGAPNVSNARRPIPHRINAFESPDTQAAKIGNLVTDRLKEKIKSIRSDPEQEETDYERVMNAIGNLQSKAVAATDSDIQDISDEVTRYLGRVFPKHKVWFDAKADTDVENLYTPFKNNADVLMGPEGGYFAPVAYQGSGARRTLLWATLKYLSEQQKNAEARPHVLLLDEPEICLHPSAIREARAVLYDLPQTGNWQVMITSHSPIFIDLSRDNTTSGSHFGRFL